MSKSTKMSARSDETWGSVDCINSDDVHSATCWPAHHNDGVDCLGPNLLQQGPWDAGNGIVQGKCFAQL